MERLQNNREILKIVSNFIEQNPDIRFIQALWVLGIIDRETTNTKAYIIDRFYEESEKTLKRIRNKGY